MSARNGDLAEVAIVHCLTDVVRVFAIVRGLAMIDGAVTGILFGLFGMKLGMLVVVDRFVESFERNHIQNIAEQEQ